MQAGDVIIYKTSDSDALKRSLAKSLRYALVSFPFTVNRMNLKNPRSRIANILKGKLAEALLELYGVENNIPMDFSAGETPFWTSDNFDFKLGNTAFDLKNNFVNTDETMASHRYLHLPALVPNRFDGDQWSKRNSHPENALRRAFVFSFISQGRSFKSPLFDLHLEPEQVNFLVRIAERFSGTEIQTAPFAEEWFLDELSRRGPEPRMELRRSLELVICGVATGADFDKFLDTDGVDAFGYAMYQKRWYTLRQRLGLSFMDGLVTTKIKNATCPMEALPSFSSFLRAFEK